jgi:putative spermidine/putrescine transport system ATP-binding protein
MAKPPDQPGGVELTGVSKSLGGQAVLRDFDLAVERGEFLSLLAPSGAGKSTVLNVIAGFLQVDAGRVTISGRDVTALPASRRDVGFIFQDFALFPHLTAAENVAFPLKVRRMGRAEIGTRVEEALRLVGLERFGARRPAALSGGQRQRVAIARALVYRPPVLLMDEPLSSLDRALREEMTHEIRRLQRTLAVTVLYVTHDQQEALTLSDRIGVLRDGRIEQLDAPSAMHNGPRSVYVGRLVGPLNAAPLADVSDRGNGLVYGRLGTAEIRARRPDRPVPGDPQLGVRPYSLSLAPESGEPAGGDRNAVRARVTAAELNGAGIEYTLEMEWGESWRALSDERQAAFEPGTEVLASWPVTASMLMES